MLYNLTEVLFNNPVLAIAIVLVAFGIAIALKVGAKVFKLICIIGIVYVAINFLSGGIF